MKNNTVSTELVTTDFQTYLQTLEPIPQETMDEIIKDAAGIVTWVKYDSAGFIINDTVVPSIQGVVQFVKPYFSRWEGDQADKRDSLDDLTEEEAAGFERRCDIHVMTVAGLLVGISMPKTSYYGRFAPFVKMLSEKGLNPADVVTEINVTQRKSALGVYNVLNFRPVRFLREAKDDFGKIPF